VPRLASAVQARVPDELLATSQIALLPSIPNQSMRRYPDPHCAGIRPAYLGFLICLRNSAGQKCPTVVSIMGCAFYEKSGEATGKSREDSLLCRDLNMWKGALVAEFLYAQSNQCRSTHVYLLPVDRPGHVVLGGSHADEYAPTECE